MIVTHLLVLSQSEAPTAGVLDIIFAGGVTGLLFVLLLVALSMIALALAVEHLIALRLTTLAPEGLAGSVAKQLTDGSLQGAAEACDRQPSVLASVLRPALGEVDGGWPAVEKAVEDALSEQSARLMRKIEYLSVISNVAPMVGLLGTVVGMIFAFQEVADTQGAARAAELASGIYQALVTTVGGLLVAIPSFAAHAAFRNRVEGLIAQVAQAASQALLPVKRHLRSNQSGKRKAESGGAI